MSKNMKFLRKGALLLAVLAMVLGQCFGMLGGVAAQAAGDYDDLVVTGITVSDAPTQVMVKGKVTANVQITLKNVGTTAIEAAENVNLDTEDIVDAYAHYDNDGASNGLQTVDNRNLTVTLGKVDLPAIAANGTATVEAVVTIEGKATNDAFDFGVFLVGRAEDDGTVYDSTAWTGAGYDAGDVPNKYKNVYFPVKIVAAPANNDDDSKDYTAIKVYAIDEDTGKVMTTIPSYKFGEKMDDIYVDAYGEDGKKLATLKWGQFTITANGTSVPATSAPIVKSKGVTSGYFEAGEVQLIFTTTRSKVVGDIVVNIEPADTETELTLQTYNTNKYDKAQDPYTADVARVKLVADVTEDTNAYRFTSDARSAATVKEEGAVAFYDNGELLATVPLGDVLDEVPVSGGYTKVTSLGSGKAVYAFVAAEGDHVYTAEYVPAGDAAKYLAGSKTTDADKKTLTVGKYTYNYATLTIEDTDLLRGEWTDVTLSFDKPVSAGTAEVKFSNGTLTRTAYFTLNDTDTSYTKTLQFETTGKWTATVEVAFQEDTKLQKDPAPETGEKDKPDTILKGTDATKITPNYAKDQDGSIRVSQTSTATALEADVTSGEVGDKVELTAAVTSGSNKVTEGAVQFVQLYVDDKGETKADNLGKPVAVTDGKAEATLTLLAKTVGVYAIYVPDAAKFTYAGSESDTIDLTVVNQAGSLKVTGPTTPVAAAGTATFTVTILGENGYRDTSADGEVTTVTVGEKTFEVDKKVTAGTTSVEISVAELNAGEQTAVVTVKSDEYGTLTGSATFTVAEPVLAATSLSINDDDLEATAAMGAAIADNITVTVMDRYGIDTYTAATGTVELYLGDALVATAKVNKGIATFENAKALTAGEDLVLTAKYLGDKAYAASQVTGDKKIDVTKLTTAMTVAVDGNELTITLNVPAGYTPNGKLAITAGETTLATIDAVEAENVVTLANPALAGEQDVTVAFTGDSGMTDATKTVKVTFEAVSGWYENPKGTWYYFEGGEMLANEWVQDGFWYYLGADGVMVKGWKQLEWNGVTDWYYFKTYAPNSGSMMTGWQFLGGKWYYMASSGKMLTGWQQLGGKWYYLDPVNGDMETGWQQLGGKWYYMDPTNGDMKTGWQKVGNTWYYMNASGAMVTGWQRLSWNGVTNWYYFQSSGAMATSGTIDGWNIASSGIATPAN